LLARHHEVRRVRHDHRIAGAELVTSVIVPVAATIE
jgi:hypothetical protein